MADAVQELLEGMVPQLHELVTYGLLTKVGTPHKTPLSLPRTPPEPPPWSSFRAP